MTNQTDLPSDYETCGDCGYDHEYEPAEAVRAHEKMNLVPCSTCGEPIPAMPAGAGVSNYGVDKDGRKHCLLCCQAREVVDAKESDAPFFYLSDQHPGATPKGHSLPRGGITLPRGDFKITSCFGGVKLSPSCVRAYRHNIGGVVILAWYDLYGKSFLGRRVGRYTEVLHSKRIKGS